MITYSGARVFPAGSPHGQGVPSVEDIALGLGRIPRFAGQTNRFWPVLLHSLLALGLAQAFTDNKRVHFLALVHDAHEVATSDVPTTWKPRCLKDDQRELDARFFAAWGVPAPAPWEQSLIRDIDLMCLACEAQVVGPPTWEPCVVTLPEPSEYGLAYVRGLSWYYPRASSTDGPKSRGVGFFISEFNVLLPSARLVL